MAAEESAVTMYDYQCLFEESACPMFVYDQQSLSFLAVNHAALEAYGYTKEEFLCLTAADIRPEDELEPFYLVNEVNPDSFFDGGRWKHKKKNGETFFAHVFAHSISFKNKKARLVLAVNMTSEINAENALAEKIGEIEDILESITDGFFAINCNWEFTYINKEFERILQVKRENIIGNNVWKMFPAAKGSRFHSEYVKVMNERVPAHFEEYYDPVQLWVSINAYPAKDGMAVFFVDITEQKKIQDKLYNDEQNLRAIINNTKDIIWSIDKHHNVITANIAYWDRVARIAGKKAEDQKPEDFDPEAIRKWNEYYTRAFGGETFKITWIENAGENTIYEEVSFNPVYNRNNVVVGINCFSRDITGQQQYQERIEKQNKKLREIAWLQSHKMRNHLANILGLVNLFNFNDTSDPFNTEIIHMLKKSSENMDEVIREILQHTNLLNQ